VADLTYDAENRLVGVSGGASASFVYDGDGNRVKATFGSSTTVYIGDYYEQTGSTIRKYLRLRSGQATTPTAGGWRCGRTARSTTC
jgi:YD repeat-containing protein